MSSHIGAPNRRLLGDYVCIFQKLQYVFRILKILIIGENEVDVKIHKEYIQKGIDYNDKHLGYIRELRSKFSTDFKNIPDEELLVSGIFVTIHKP